MGMIEDKYKEKNPFKMPEGYFDGFADKVMDKIVEEEEPAKASILPIIKTVMWMAATFVIIFGVGRVIIPLALDPSEKIQSVSAPVLAADTQTIQYDELDDLDLSDEDIIDYLSEETVDNEYLIAEL